ncbi:MAG TPA: hypothetical protein VIW03_01405 [Anaeromyxobacter sp.]
MRGTITAKDVFRHGPTIMRIWGAACFLACLRAALSPRPSTFLEVLCRCGAVRLGGRGVDLVAGAPAAPEAARAG